MKTENILRKLLGILFITLISNFDILGQSSPQANKISLAGEWRFQVDSLDKGVNEKWFSKNFEGIVSLPGSMTTNGIGNNISLNTPWTGEIIDSSWFKSPKYEKYRQPGNIKVPFWLQPTKYYVGAAWYQKTIEIPEKWANGNIELFLERCHWETRVWIDGTECGIRNSLATPHQYNLTKSLKPGKHVISIRVDNSTKDVDVGINSHSITDHTQSNWNGIVGEMSLAFHPLVSLEDIQLFPDISQKKANVIVSINNESGKKVSGKVFLQAALEGGKRDETLKLISQTLTIQPGHNEFSIEYLMGENPALWSEFNPNLYKMEVRLEGKKGETNQVSKLFGMRDFKTKGTRFSINGNPTFLRGTLECAIFPETGYPPTDVKEWIRIFKICRAHGLNHIRFHSWCPPDAAFEAADRTGFYLQIECGSWANTTSAIGDGKAIDKFIYDEGDRILKAYGNHPSFCMLAYGNEPAGKNQKKFLGELDNYWKKKDSRRLYTSGAGWPIIPEGEYISMSESRIQLWGQGLKSIINSEAPKTTFDWTHIIDKFNKPVVSHEIGQWCVYPDFKEIDRYKGVLKAKNFEMFRDELAQNNMRQLADSFLLASGKLQALCYKADIEAELRTPGLGGFQLLDLHDFPGQGTALVGVLNPFWEQKGYITPEEYSKFCNATVPLLRLKKLVFIEGEMLEAIAEVAHFGEKPLENITPEWSISTTDGRTIFRGTLATTNIPLEKKEIGSFVQPMKAFDQPTKLIVRLKVDRYENSWDIWVYPRILAPIPNEKDILVTQKLDQQALSILEKGGKVLLTVKKGTVKEDKGGSIKIGFSSIFWNTAWTKGQAPHTLGILCNPAHKALINFPTEYHSNWQWWDAMSHSNAIVLSDLPAGMNPIVRVIDDWVTNRPLGLIFEVKVGKGKLIVSGIDLLTDAEKRAETRQLLYSLKSYMASNNFNPKDEVKQEVIRGLFKD